jgi:hypothetical protein
MLYERYFEQSPSPPDELSLIVLDSCGPVCWPIITRGHVPIAEIEELPERIATARGCKLVVLHHSPLRESGRPDWPWHALRGARDLMKAAARAEAVLCGHLHQRFDARQESRVFCAGSSTELGKEGYWLYQIDNGRLLTAEVRKPGAP